MKSLFILIIFFSLSIKAAKTEGLIDDEFKHSRILYGLSILSRYDLAERLKIEGTSSEIRFLPALISQAGQNIPGHYLAILIGGEIVYAYFLPLPKRPQETNRVIVETTVLDPASLTLKTHHLLYENERLIKIDSLSNLTKQYPQAKIKGQKVTVSQRWHPQFNKSLYDGLIREIDFYPQIIQKLITKEYLQQKYQEEIQVWHYKIKQLEKEITQLRSFRSKVKQLLIEDKLKMIGHFSARKSLLEKKQLELITDYSSDFRKKLIIDILESQFYPLQGIHPSINQALERALTLTKLKLK